MLQGIKILYEKTHYWRHDDGGVAAMEFALVFPVLLTLLMGVYDFGNAFLVNQKAITASQMMADLVSRNVSLTENELDDVVNAGRMAIAPFSTASFGYDIVSIEFDEDEAPTVCWRHSGNIEEREELLDSTEPLALEGEGMVAVAVEYVYEPLFAGRIMGDLQMREVAYARGRRTPVVSLSVDDEVGCEDEL